jgi:hypothetical protein
MAKIKILNVTEMTVKLNGHPMEGKCRCYEIEGSATQYAITAQHSDRIISITLPLGAPTNEDPLPSSGFLVFAVDNTPILTATVEGSVRLLICDPSKVWQKFTPVDEEPKCGE